MKKEIKLLFAKLRLEIQRNENPITNPNGAYSSIGTLNELEVAVKALSEKVSDEIDWEVYCE